MREKARVDEINLALQEVSVAGIEKGVAQVEGIIKKAGLDKISIKSFADETAINKYLDDTKNKGIKKHSTDQGFIIQYKDGSQEIIINKDVAAKDQAVSVAGHEFLHALLRKTFADTPDAGKRLGDALFKEISKIDMAKVIDSKLLKRINQYNAAPENVQGEEVLTLFSDAIATGDIKFNENIFTKIGDTVRSVLQSMGVKVKFNNGRDVYNFIKDYNKSLAKTELTTAQKEAVTEGIAGELITPTKVEKKATTVKPSKAEKEVSIDELAKQYKNDPTDVNIDIESLLTQYQKLGKDALKTWAAKRNVPYKFDVKEVEALLGKEFESIMKNYKPIDTKTGKPQKLSTYMGNVIGRRIGPGIVEEYTRKTKQVSGEKLPDTQTVKQKELDLGPKATEKGPRLIDPRNLTNVKNKIKEIEKEVTIKEEQVALANFKWISDNFGGKVASIIYNVPEAKIKDATKNLAYARKFVDGVPESSEAGSIQQDFAQINEVRSFLNILPPYNISTPESIISKQGETIATSKDVQGRSLGLSGKVQDYFYENYIDPTGEITTKKGRSKGSTSQVPVKRLKPQFRDNISNETIKQLQKDLGITPTGQLNVYDRTIGQFLKGIAKLKGAITANTIIDKQIEKMDLKTAKGKKQVTADTRAGRAVVQAAKAETYNKLSVE